MLIQPGPRVPPCYGHKTLNLGLTELESVRATAMPTDNDPNDRHDEAAVSSMTCARGGGNQHKHCAPSRTRTDTWRILSPLPLPIGLWGPGGESSLRRPDL